MQLQESEASSKQIIKSETAEKMIEAIVSDVKSPRLGEVTASKGQESNMKLNDDLTRGLKCSDSSIEEQKK